MRRTFFCQQLKFSRRDARQQRLLEAPGLWNGDYVIKKISIYPSSSRKNCGDIHKGQCGLRHICRVKPHGLDSPGRMLVLCYNFLCMCTEYV